MTPSSRRTSLARKRWQKRRVQWVAALSLLDSPLRRPAPVVEGDDGPIGPGLGGHWLDGSMVNAGASLSLAKTSSDSLSEHRDPSIRRQAHDSEPSWR